MKLRNNSQSLVGFVHLDILVGRIDDDGQRSREVDQQDQLRQSPEKARAQRENDVVGEAQAQGVVRHRGEWHVQKKEGFKAKNRK